MDLSAIKPVEGILEIIHPGSGEQLGIKISLLSLDDDALKKAKQKIQNASSVLTRKGKSFTAEEIEQNTNLLAFTAMTGWEWTGVTVIDEPERNEQQQVHGTSDFEIVNIPAVTHFEPALFHQEKPAFTVANVYKVFNELPWFRDQITDKVGDAKSFFTI